MKFTFRQAICTLTVLSLAWSLLPSARALPDTKSESVPLQAVLDLQSNLLQTGYSQDEITVLAANLRTQTLVRLSAQALIPRLTEYVALDYFHEDRLDRYCAYAALHPDYSPEDVVTYVNIGLDQPRYSVYDIVADPYALDVLVNQYHSLGDDYAPELVRLSTDYTLASKDYLRPEAYQWFIRMANAARREGLTLRSVSAYRSYNTQDSLYKRYVKQDGVAAADRYSARPSFSEHQTGLALDINVAGSRYHFEDTSEYQWLIENCWDYGFILRYPSGKTHITGYIYEPWHYRYVGIELAHQLRDSGLTYDEYMARQPVEKAVETVETQAPSFTVDGVPVEFSSLILLDGTIYLSVNELADTLGWSFSWWGDTLRVTSSQHTFSLPGSDLTRSSAVCNGVLYLELSDLIRQLNMSCLQADNRVQISSVRLPDGWTFTDVFPYNDWYEDIRFVWQSRLFSGTGANQFSPNEGMTRGMAVTVLQKLAPDTTPTAAATFSDVLEEDWFAAGVSWAAASGVAGGYPDGRFRPNQVLTRQEAAVMLHAFAQYMGCSFYCFSLPPQITDAAQVESWAHSAVSWAYQRNLLVLREGSTLAPNEPITRAEMAHALTVLCKNILF